MDGQPTPEAAPPVPAEPPKTGSLTQQWVLLAVLSAIFIGAGVAEEVSFPAEAERGQRTPLTCVMMVVAVVGQALWITMDRQRRGLEVGWWRFGAILLGPLVIWLYLALEYGRRALYLIPLSMGIYAVNFIAPWGIALVLA